MSDPKEKAEQLKQYFATAETDNAKNEGNPELKNNPDYSAYTDTPEEEKTEPETENISPLPAPLRLVQMQQILVAIVTGIAAIACSAALRQVKFLSFLLLSLYFVLLAFLLEYDWRRGNILQIVAVCTHVFPRTRSTQIICRDMQSVYSFFLPNKKSDFAEGYVYAIWVRRSNPKAALAYQPL